MSDYSAQFSIIPVLDSSDNQRWLQCWRDQQTDFHQTLVNPLLKKFWSSLNLARGSRVFVPLCGKSLDMIWLVQQGYEVIGVELSPVAVQDFFRDNSLKPVKRKLGKFTLWNYGKLSILCGDYFALSKVELGVVDTVYDRAALTALPEDVRRLYVEQLKKIVPKTARIFLLTIEDAAQNATLNEAVGIDEEIKALYSSAFDIDLAYVESVYEPDLNSPNQPAKRAEYKVYKLSSKSSLNFVEMVLNS